jgi:preprotein translocase subunit SecF
MKIDFIGKRASYYAISLLVVLTCIGFLFFKGLNLGIEFRSGSILRVSFEEQVTTEDVKKILGLEKFKVYFQRIKVQVIDPDDTVGQRGHEFFITSDFIPGKLGEDGIDALVLQEFQKVFPSAKTHKFVNIGPSIGDDLKEAAIYSILFSLLVIILYITIRFDFRYAMVAILALVHDVMIVLGVFALTQKPFESSTIAALLTIIGYSLNDTIVILDRIRENIRLMRKEKFDRIVNNSLNQTLSRTINTSITTLCPILVLFAFGGTGVASFSFALLIGVVVGTYSSVCLAAQVLVSWELNSPQEVSSFSGTPSLTR